MACSFSSALALALVLAATTGAAAAGPFGVAASVERRDAATTLVVSFAVPQGHYLYADAIRVGVASSFSLAPLSIPAPKKKHDPFSDAEREVYDGDFAQTFRLTPSAVDTTVTATVAYQGCSESFCFLPVEKRFDLKAQAATEAALAEAAGGKDVSTTGAASRPGPGPSALPTWKEAAEFFAPPTAVAVGYQGKKEFLEFLDRGLGLRGPEPVAGDKGIVLTLLGFLFGGLLLNLTPCVLPMIPINLAIIGAGSRASSRARGFAVGATYGAGIALAYGLLGVVAVSTGAMFGTLNASPWFNFAVAAIFVLLALAAFHVYALDLSRLRRAGVAPRAPGQGAGPAGPGRYALALFMGAVSALLAGACVAPVVLSVLLFAGKLYAAGNKAALFLPFLLGLGMAAPWPFAGAGLSFLPKPGRWMKGVERGFGVLILLFAAYYGWTGVSLLRDRLSDEKARELASVQARREAEEEWFVELGPALEEARRQGKPVLIDFWASWCKNCLAMDGTTLRDPDVRARLDGFVKAKYQAEDPSAPETAEVLEYFGVWGLPTYVVLQLREGG